jgi:hypothetical protein
MDFRSLSLNSPSRHCVAASSLRLTAEAGAEPIEELAHASQQRPRGPRRHDRRARDAARQYKYNRIERRGL